MPILTTIQLMGKYWQLVAGFVLAAVSFGYGYSMASDKCVRENQAAVTEFQNHANEQAKGFEGERAKIEANKRKVANVKIIHTGCNVTADGLSKLNAVLANDTSKFN
jgi:hypothetical protein